jgi:nicotinamidase-related amidase
MAYNMKKCLIVVDFQNDFVMGALGFPAAVELDERIAEKIVLYRESGDDVIFTYDTHGDDYHETQEGRNLPIAHCVDGTQGHGLYGKTALLMDSSDLRFKKNAFGSDALYAHLRNVQYEGIELVGLVSNICVIANAVLAKTAQPETLVTVDARCVASHDSRLNQAALDVMSGLQIRILNS